MTTRVKKPILIVDNQPRETTYLQKQLEIAGFEAAVATTGEGAIRRLKERAPQLVLLETGLSDMNGLNVVEFIRGDPKTACIPVVAMSIFPHMKDMALQAGCSEFVQKPIRILEMITRLRRLMRT